MSSARSDTLANPPFNEYGSCESRETPQRFIPSPSGAVCILMAVTVIWGGQHVVIKLTIAGANTLQCAELNMWRFGIASILFAPWLPRYGTTKSDEQVWLEQRGGIELGFWLFMGFGLHTLGLTFTTALRGALLLYLNVKLVPLIKAVVFRDEVPVSAWFSAVFATIGTFLVVGDNAAATPFNVGDALCLLSAASSAMFILRLENFALTTDATAICSVSTLFVAVLSLLCCIAIDLGGAVRGSVPFLGDNLVAILYLAVVTTAFTNLLQTIGQRSVTATTAAVIYALDPMWACLFSFLFLGDLLGVRGIVGCLVLMSVWLYQLRSAWHDDGGESETFVKDATDKERI